jgi:hypothetical protein
MKSSQKTKLISFVAAGLFVLTGTYNSVVINSESQINGSGAKFVKRLDELYGVTVPGREVAASVSWQKLPQSPKALPKKVYDTVSVKASSQSSGDSGGSAPAPQAAVQEELSLSLVEVINPKKWQQGLTNSQFSGSLSTNSGVIEDLSVALPNGENVSVSFSEMNGNVFEYDMNGDLYSGMMYQVDQNSYMVTLTNGPLEGTRLRFTNQEAQAEQQQIAQETLAETNVDPGTFGQESVEQTEQSMNQYQAQEITTPEQMNQADQMLQQQAMETQGYQPAQQTM